MGVKVWIGLCALIAHSVLAVSNYDEPFKPEQSLGIAFRSAENPYYWKNSKPHAAYWQQDVHYKIQAELNEKTRIISGKQTLIYYNNSPDTLSEAYFHLYQNAYKPGSYADQYAQAVHNYRIADLKKGQEGKTEIRALTDGEGLTLRSRFDDTIFWVGLNKPLVPGDSTIFNIEFQTFFGSYKRRMKFNPRRGAAQFNAAHWYPRIAVYDHKFGWHTDQHLGREFYGDFGTFEYELTLPNHYIVAATGFLLNRDEALPDSLMRKLDILNFAEKNFYARTSEIIKPEPGKTKTWKFRAVNVHDIAWSADPSYRIGMAEWDGIKCYAFVREWKAAYWQDAAQFSVDVIRVLSEDFGRYGYHKMTMVDADDGMEYPMITFDGGYSPSYYSLFVHEISHSWFFAMVGSNETYRPFMDEGFTQFLTAWAMEKLVEGPDTENLDLQLPYLNDERERFTNYLRYYEAVKSGRDVPLNTHSVQYNVLGEGRYMYWQCYYKTAVMLYNLQYVLGVEKQRAAMAHYVNKWKFCHPYPEDFEDAITEYTGWDLRWFFDQWIYKTRTVDYAIDDLNAKQIDGTWHARVKLRRKGTAIMPLDLFFKLENGETRTAVVPVSYDAKTEGDILALPKWTGWGDFNTEYLAEVKLPAKPVSVEIDPSGRLADVYRLDNSSAFFPKFELKPMWVRRDWNLDKYRIEYRPRIGFNRVDGFRFGVNLEGGYVNRWGYGDQQINLNLNTGFLLPEKPAGYSFSYQQPLEALDREAFLTLSSKADAGYQASAVSFYQIISGSIHDRKNYTTMDISLYFGKPYDLDYFRAKPLWAHQKNHHLKLQIDRYYRLGRSRQQGTISFQLINAMPGSEQNYSRLSLETRNELNFWRINSTWRSMLGMATATTPAFASFFPAMGSPIEWVNSYWLNTRGALPEAWSDDGHLHPAGGGNVRAAQAGLGTDPAAMAGANRLAALNVEFGLWNPWNRLVRKVPIAKQLLLFDFYGFADLAAGALREEDSDFKLNDPIWDAGVGVVWQPRLGRRTRGLLGEPLHLRFDVPFYFSDPLPGENTFDWRWVVGIQRAF